MSKYKVLLISVVILGLMPFLHSGVGAQTTDTTVSNQADQAISESAGLDDQLEPLDDIQVDEAESIPSSFGFWWRNIREWTSLALTLDPVKKAEKQLKFAEERTRLANYIIQNSTDPKVQEKAQRMIEKANQYMQRIEDKKDELAKRADEKSQKILDNIAKHNLNKQRVLEKIEDKLSPEKIEEFQQLRKAIEEKDKNFLENLQNNPNIPQEVKDRISNTMSRIQDMQKAREELRVQQKDILEAIKAGSQEAKDQFEKLREERKQNLEKIREQFKEQKDEIINKIKAGDENAVERLKELNQRRQAEAEKMREEIKQKATEMRNEMQQRKQEELDKLRQLKEGTQNSDTDN
ncbi:MAG: DUF5667 domain-containing protein [Candidatus Woesearchaeota archaeon]|nr:DUF5667 domain-containing protein [Candidatus Woesearchaeota archaeon]